MRILIAAGSSGGHIFPAIATASKLRELNSKNEIVFMGTNKDLDIDILKNQGYRFHTISSNKRLLEDLFRAYSVLREFRPKVVVGFGGYVSFPVLAVARLMGISTLIHEQNLVPGLANRLLSYVAHKVGVSFSSTCNFFMNKARVVETGNPIRAGLIRLKRDQALGIFGLETERFTVMVMGGSQGAHFINDAALDAVKAMSETERRYFQFIHLSGPRDFEFVRSGYEALGVTARVFSFCERMSEVYSASDMVISRAGATSIAEIAFFGIAAILIPYPDVRVHQGENARHLAQKGAAIVIEQKALSPTYLKEVVLNLMRDRNRLKALSESVARLSVPDAAQKLVKEIMDVTEG